MKALRRGCGARPRCDQADAGRHCSASRPTEPAALLCRHAAGTIRPLLSSVKRRPNSGSPAGPGNQRRRPPGAARRTPQGPLVPGRAGPFTRTARACGLGQGAPFPAHSARLSVPPAAARARGGEPGGGQPLRALPQPGPQFRGLLAGHQLRFGAGQDGPQVFQLGLAGQPVQPGQLVLHGGPVNAVVDVARGVEVRGAQRPRPARRRLRRPRMGQPRRDLPPLRRGPVDPLERLAQRDRPPITRRDRDPDRGGLDKIPARPAHDGGALGPPRARGRAIRPQRNSLPVRGIPADGQGHAAQQPEVRAVPAGVADIVFGGLLEVSRERIEPEPARGDHIRAAHLAGGGEHPALRGIGAERRGRAL